MSRKRCKNTNSENKENEKTEVVRPDPNRTRIFSTFKNVQKSSVHHRKYMNDLKNIYTNTDHKRFTELFIMVMKSFMQVEEGNEHADRGLKFCAEYITSFNGEETHVLMKDVLHWSLGTMSHNPVVRFRLCQFINLTLEAMGPDATLDDSVCDNILSYMLKCLEEDCSANVRVQAIKALERLQVPEDISDPVIHTYVLHMSHDPSPRVRQAAITCICKNFITVPHILERLWDSDEKVRKHIYVQLNNYNVRSFRSSERLIILEQGLNDRSDAIRKVFLNVMLRNWLQCYEENPILLIKALVQSLNPTEIDRFRKICKQMLAEIFNRERDKKKLVEHLPLDKVDEFRHCVPYDKLSREVVIYWECLAEYLAANGAEEYDDIVPELSAYCNYVENFCKHAFENELEHDSLEYLSYQYDLLSLMEILYTFDLGDEIGRGNLRNTLEYMLLNIIIDEKIIQVIIRCLENLIPDQDERFKFLVDKVEKICNINQIKKDVLQDRALINELLDKCTDTSLKLKLTSLKVKMMELEEEESLYIQEKSFQNAQNSKEKRNSVAEEFNELMKPLIDAHTGASNSPQLGLRIVKKEFLIKGLQISYYMVVSEKVKALKPVVCKLYNDFICRHLASNELEIRNWALKCGTAFSLFYEPLAEEVYLELCVQIGKHQNESIWLTTITCIFELLDRYGVEHFERHVQQPEDITHSTTRPLFNSMMTLVEENAPAPKTSVIDMLTLLLTQVDNKCKTKVALAFGFCRLILHGRIKKMKLEILEKLLLLYFDPSSGESLSQTLGLFFEALLLKRKDVPFEEILLPCIYKVMDASYNSSLLHFNVESIARFVIDATRLDPALSKSNKVNPRHLKLARLFLNEMLKNVQRKELLKFLAKELITLEVNVKQNVQLKIELIGIVDKLLEFEMDSKTAGYLRSFKSILEGFLIPQPLKPLNDKDAEDATNQDGIMETDISTDDQVQDLRRSTHNASLAAPSTSSRSHSNAISLVTTTATPSLPSPIVSPIIADQDHIETPSTSTNQSNASEEIVETARCSKRGRIERVDSLEIIPASPTALPDIATPRYTRSRARQNDTKSTRKRSLQL